MTNKEFWYSMYNRDLVDYAMESIKDFYIESTLEADMKRAKAIEKSGGKKASETIYNYVLQQLTFSFLEGASYAIDAGLTSTQPSESSFSEFHKNVDFAALFNFSDNDFGLAMEAGAKAFCDEFNSKLIQIDLYDDHDTMRSSFIKAFNEMCKIENIKEIMKCGFAAQRLKHSAKVICGRMPNIVEAMKFVQNDLDYIPWDKTRIKWKKIGEEHVKSGELPRFITGTNAEIAEVLKQYGSPWENSSEDAEFPVWCNGEVVILYMKNGYLKYMIR